MTTHLERRVTFDRWQEPSGYWSAFVLVRLPGMADWKQSATGFADSDEALEWCRSQVDMATGYA